MAGKAERLRRSLVAPRVEWERDLDYDLVGLGLINPAQIPLRQR